MIAIRVCIVPQLGPDQMATNVYERDECAPEQTTHSNAFDYDIEGVIEAERVEDVDEDDEEGVEEEEDDGYSGVESTEAEGGKQYPNDSRVGHTPPSPYPPPSRYMLCRLRLHIVVC